MIFNANKQKGIRKKSLPEPNPVRVEMKKDSSIFDVFEKAIELYYQEFNITINDVILADSTGGAIPLADDDLSGWKLGEYYLKNNLVPSRYKLYTMVDLSLNKVCCDHED